MGRLRGKSSGSAAVDAARVRKAKRQALVIDATPGTKRYEAAMLRAKSAVARLDLNERWKPWEGTPETNERIARVPVRRRQSPLDRMAKLGTITAEELAASEEIVRTAELIQRQVGIGSASLEARVDHGNSARDVVVESLGRIRAEVAYTAWRNAIPQPRALILDMLLTNMGYVKLARLHGLHWRTARRLLLTALRMWPEYRIAARHSVTEATVHEVYQLLGEGTLVVPKPKAEMAALNEDAAR